jgi:hypothetical protein
MAYDSNLGRLPDPTTIPAGPGFVSQQILDNTPGMIHNLNTGGSVSVKFSGSYWTINIGYPQLTIAQSNEIISFIYGLQGGFTNFYVQLPNKANPASGAWGATGITVGNLTNGTNTNQVDVQNWDNRGAGNELEVGDMIKFTVSNKIYLIVATDYVSAAVGTQTLTLNSDRPSNMAASDLEPNGIQFRVRIRGNPPAFNLNPDGLYEGFSLSLRENIL